MKRVLNEKKEERQLPYLPKGRQAPRALDVVLCSELVKTTSGSEVVGGVLEEGNSRRAADYWWRRVGNETQMAVGASRPYGSKVG